MIDLKNLVKAGVHFGHQRSRWCPKMEPYIWGIKNNVHLIDVSKTASQLEKAASFLEGLTRDGKSVLWIGTKKPAQAAVTKAGQDLKQCYVSHRWIGGTLTNFGQVKKAITKFLHFEDVVAKSDREAHTKKELAVITKMLDRSRKNVGGLIDLKWPVGALVLVDVRKERSALKEAIAQGVPVVALVDTNSDPDMVDYVIPANDDSPRSIACIIEYLAEAVRRGQVAKADLDKKTQTEAAEKKKAALDEAAKSVKAAPVAKKKAEEAAPTGEAPEAVLPDETDEEDEETADRSGVKAVAKAPVRKALVKKSAPVKKAGPRKASDE